MKPSNNPPPTSTVVEIRKYPNRRYYDSTHSRHLTLEDIRLLVKEGRNVRVLDSHNRMDITAKVLTQIILELDSPKLDLFPVPLLTELIRVNDQLVKGFFEKFFEQTVRSFFAYQKHLETQVRDQTLFPGLFPAFPDWAPSILNPLTNHASAPPSAASATRPADAPAAAELAKTVQSLQEQVEALQRKLKEAQPAVTKRGVRKARPREG